MLAVDTFIKILKICRIEPEIKTYKHCRTYPHPLFTEDYDLYEEEETHGEVCDCCVVKNNIEPDSRGRKKKHKE